MNVTMNIFDETKGLFYRRLKFLRVIFSAANFPQSYFKNLRFQVFHVYIFFYLEYAWIQERARRIHGPVDEDGRQDGDAGECSDVKLIPNILAYMVIGRHIII